MKKFPRLFLYLSSILASLLLSVSCIGLIGAHFGDPDSDSPFLGPILGAGSDACALGVSTLGGCRPTKSQ